MTFSIVLSSFTFATFILARLQTTVSQGVYFIVIFQSSIVSSMNFEGEVF